MRKKNEEQKQKPLTIYEKWQKDSEESNGGIGFDESECDGEYIEIEESNKEK
jgi:hypothetical protein